MSGKKKIGQVVRLEDVVEYMDLPSEEWTSHLNRRTGELVTVTGEDARAVEDGEEPEEPKAREARESGDYLELPGRFEIDEYRIMERFSRDMENDAIRDELLQAIGGRGAFRRFREVIHDRRITETWYAYRQEALERIAADWLEVNGIRFTRGKPAPGADDA